MSVLLVVSVALTVGLGVSSTAQAQDSVEDRPVVTLRGEAAEPASVTGIDRPWFVMAGFGAAIGFGNATDFFRINEAFGYHFAPIGIHPGFWIALDLAQNLRSNVRLFEFGARFGFDIVLLTTQSLALILAPNVATGFGLFVVDFGGIGRGDSAGFVLQPASTARLVFLEGRLSVWVRPLAFDIFIGDFTEVWYNVLGGAMFSF
ncbi:MAG: hypothetical protein ACFCGT_07915 [Sandaracinaceae bacterium]